jgi:hypothetical protein
VGLAGACPRCGWMGVEAIAARSTAARWSLASILEEAVPSAVSQSAEVLALRERPELGPLGGIAATLRF